MDNVIDVLYPKSGLLIEKAKQICRLFSRNLRYEALAAFSAASSQDVLSTDSLHASTESVSAAAFGSAWLKCSFHKNYAPLKILRNERTT